MIDLTSSMSKQGVIDALNIILTSRQRPIVSYKNTNDDTDKDINGLKMPKNSQLIDINDNDFNDENKSDEENKAENERRLSKIKDELSDENIEQTLNDIETDNIFKQQKAAEIEKEKELAKKSPIERKTDIKPADFKLFERDLSQTVKKQIGISTDKEDSFRRVNPTYAGSKLLMPGKATYEKRMHPLINVYIDASGSLSADKEEQGKDSIRKALDELKKKDLLDYKLYWFADNVSDTRAGAHGSTRAFPEILKHIKETRADNVIIFTDNDFDRQTTFNQISMIQIRGCVWWIWANNKIANRARNYINARQIFQYSF